MSAMTLAVISGSVSCSDDGLQPEAGKTVQEEERPQEGLTPEKTKYYVDIVQKEYEVGSEGGTVTIAFSTNVPERMLGISASGATMMIENTGLETTGDDLTDDEDTMEEDNAGLRPEGYEDLTTEDTGYELRLTIRANSTPMQLSARIIFSAEDFWKQEILNTVTVTQSGTEAEESEDYSADGQTVMLQEATEGEGIPIVIMGDGFIDTEIADGTYAAVMEKAYGNLFTEEPIKSLKDYFDVYYITAVSKNNIFGTGYGTAFGCELEGSGSTGISGDLDKVIEYVSKVDGVDAAEALAVVVLNSEEYAGTTYFGFSEGDEMTEFAIAFCPTIYGMESEQFREVLTHEAVGHGFAKLEDEYSYEGMITMSEKRQIQSLQELGWARNVDFTTDETQVLWSAFLSDSSYADEGLGIYEGACTYSFGVYRPSEDSMMNSNTVGFNAPSRQSIYDKVMSRGEGREPDYEEFTAFDLSTRTLTAPATSSLTKSSGSSSRFSRPVFANRSISPGSRQ